MNRAQKEEVVRYLREKADRASIAIVTDFKGVKVEEMTELRADLRKNGVEYQVVKNTLARIALSEGPHAVLTEEFKECCAVAFGYDDPVVAAKVLVEFAKKSKKFSLRFGSLEGKFLEEAAINELSALPGKEQLLAKLLGTMNAVPTNFVGLLANVPRNFLYALNAIKEQKEQAS
ncbi:MAG: 50S ribosomal protein L10 [Desulfovibrionales bacterium]